jgi:hypothetical protein
MSEQVPRISKLTKLCPKCGQTKPHRDFHKGGRGSKPQSWCKECVKQRYQVQHASRKAAGICRYCDEPARPGKTRCEAHAAKARAYYADINARAKQLLSAARRRARRDGVRCAVSVEWIRRALDAGCELTGAAFDFGIAPADGHFAPYAPSIDRREPGGDYTPENCRVIICALNVALNRWGEAVYRDVAVAYLSHARDVNAAQSSPLRVQPSQTSSRCEAGTERVRVAA